MLLPTGEFAHRLRTALGLLLAGPQAMAFLPAMTLASYWLGGESLLLVTALSLPGLLYAAGRIAGPVPDDAEALKDPVTGLPLRAAAVTRLDRLLSESETRERTTACLVLAVDDFHDVERRLGAPGSERILGQVAERLASALRDTDLVARLPGPGFAIVVSALRRADLETLIQLSVRLQRELGEAFSLDSAKVYLTVSIGFCFAGRAPAATGEGYLAGAEQAQIEAAAAATGSIRAFSKDMQIRTEVRSGLAEDLSHAIDSGRIAPWFQPQVDIATGRVSGLEALARWDHPTRGLVPPAEFLPLVEASGLTERLGEAILHRALSTLKDCDAAGVRVPEVSVNFTLDELRNPQLPERLRWEIDRFDLAPSRLTIEVLETVIASTGNDTVVRNLWTLSEMGFGIDLDDFGTGHAAIANIRRFSVRRLKIDRSFVTRLDTDEDQQNLVSAILVMAERMGVATLAEGVETPGEFATLARLGCGYAQGYGIARPMPASALVDWLNGRDQALGPAEASPSPGTARQRPDGGRETGKTA